MTSIGILLRKNPATLYIPKEVAGRVHLANRLRMKQRLEELEEKV
jgi:hypothetical protein